MPLSISNDLAIRSASFALDALSVRQKVTANNIANVDTPNFKAQQVSFEEQLQQSLHRDKANLRLKTTSSGHIQYKSLSDSNLIVVKRNNNTLRNDGNNVDIDLEMTTLAETSIRFQALTQLTGNKLTLIKDIVREGR
ncbi:MAG: flagellar basal body rod protein FlgB [Anaerolineae bacterium]|nr:flagellar basal body rod protein FlgB [Anaerolineae bacterium]